MVGGFVKIPNTSKYIRWIDEETLEVIDAQKIKVTDKIRNNDSIDLLNFINKETNNHYKDLWKMLKDELIKDFNKETKRLKNIPTSTDYKFLSYIHGKIEGQRSQVLSHLLKMEDLDGSYEFKNLLDDINSEEK